MRDDRPRRTVPLLDERLARAPTAKQLVGLAHAIDSSAAGAATPGLGTTDQVVPSQLSMIGVSLFAMRSKPTTKQLVTLGHAMS